MQHVKPNLSTASSATSVNQNRINESMDPAAKAGLPKVEFYKTDRWIVGRDDIKTYVVPKNTIPEPLAKVFLPTAKPDPVTDKVQCDRRKFEIDEWPDYEFAGGRVAIGLRASSEEVADVQFVNESFVVRIFDLPETSPFSFNKDEFLKAINVAKWTLELYVLPRPYRETKEP